MDMQGFETRRNDWRHDPAPAPLCLETLDAVEQMFLQMLRSLRSEATASRAQAAAAAEYDSWRSVRAR